MLNSSILSETSAITRFAGRFFGEAFRPRYEVRALVRQCYEGGCQSLPLVGSTGFIIGLVLTLRLRPTMVQFGAESWIPVMVGLTIIREMAPIVTGLMASGKVGASMGAELSSTRVTEQIDAMAVSGTNPFKYLVVARILAATRMVPVLTVLATVIGLYAAYLGINRQSTTTGALFANNILGRLPFDGIGAAVVKTFFWGFAIGLIGCYEGYYADTGTEDVGRAANSAVVTSSLAIFVLDLLAVRISTLLGIN